MMGNGCGLRVGEGTSGGGGGVCEMISVSLFEAFKIK